MTGETPDLRNRRILYGRRSARGLSERRKALVETLLPRLAVSLGALEQPRSLFAHKIDDLWLEVGFGGGEHLAAQATAHPNIGLIGCEPFIEGVGRALEHIEDAGLQNVRLHPDDAREVIERLPDNSLGRVFVLFPDPWPKTRHWKRRFINPDNLIALARVLRPNAVLRVASDKPDYIAWAKEQVALGKHLRLTGEFVQRPADWPSTRYEQKALKQHTPCRYLEFAPIG